MEKIIIEYKIKKDKITNTNIQVEIYNEKNPNFKRVYAFKNVWDMRRYILNEGYFKLYQVEFKRVYNNVYKDLFNKKSIKTFNYINYESEE